MKATRRRQRLADRSRQRFLRPLRSCDGRLHAVHSVVLDSGQRRARGRQARETAEQPRDWLELLGEKLDMIEGELDAGALCAVHGDGGGAHG